MRLHLTLLSLFLTVGLASAGGDLAGHWKVTFLKGDQLLNYWLLNLENKDGKLVGSTEPTSSKVLPTNVDKVQIDGDLVSIEFKLPRGPGFRFEGKLPRAGAKKIYGSIDLGDGVRPAFLEATKAKNVFELNQEFVARSPSDPRVFEVVLDLIRDAKQNKVAPRDVQEWVDAGMKTAESYGPALEGDYGVRLVNALGRDYSALAIETAKTLDKNIGSRLAADQQLTLWSTLATALAKNGQAEEAAKMIARMDAAEEAAYKAYEAKSIDFKADKFTGKWGRPLLVELFTGANCGPCVAADLAFDGLEKSFTGGELVFLQYHMHIPGPDPLTSPINDPRSEFYGRTFKGTPTYYFNGEPIAGAGGSRKDAGEVYEQLKGFAEKSLKEAAGAKVTVSAKRKGDEVSIDANVTDVAERGKLKLRVVLVEDWVRYKGSNGVAYHHNVVRAMLGGVEGFAIAGKGLQKTGTIDLAEVRRAQEKYLSDTATKDIGGPVDEVFPNRPIRLRDLHVVAFVQSDDSGEVFGAVSVPVKNE
jgi:hypothetical protein